MTYYVIRWDRYGGKYIRDLSRNDAYTVFLNEAKRWKTRKNAERFLSRKDPTWASQCVIEEISQVDE